MIKINTAVKNAAHQSKRYMQKKAFWNDSHNQKMWEITEDVMGLRDRLSLKVKRHPYYSHQNIDGTAALDKWAQDEQQLQLVFRGDNILYSALKNLLKEQADKIRPLIEKTSRM